VAVLGSKREGSESGGILSRKKKAQSFENVLGVKPPTLDVGNSQLGRDIERFEVEQASKPPEPPEPSFLDKSLSILGRPKEVGKMALDIVGRPSQVLAEMATPTAPMIRPAEGGGSENIPGTNAREELLKRTGQRPAEGSERVLGAIGASFLPMGGGGPLGPSSGNLYRAAGDVAEQFLTRAGTGLGGRVAREVATEAMAGVPLGIGQSLGTGSGDMREAVTEGLIGGALGVGLGAAGPAIGAAGKRILGRSKAPDAPTGTSKAQVVEPTVSPEKSPAEEAKPMQQNWFTRLFGEQNLGITPFGSNKSNRMVETAQQIVNNPLKNNVTGAVEKTKQAGRAAYQNTVDYLSPLKTINRETYDAALDASRANNIANTIVRDKFVDNEGNVIGSSLNDIMTQVRGLGKKFDDYIVLRHAITRMKRGEKVYDDALNMTPEKAAEAVAKLEARYPEIKKAGEDWDAFNTNLLDSGVREGLISQAARDAMREQNPNYASMRRQFELGEKLARPRFGGGGSAFSGQSAPIKSVSPTGSTRKIVSPIRSAIEQAYAWKNAELRNRTMQQVVKSIQADPEGMKGIVEIVKKPSTSYRSLDDALREGGSEEFLEQLDNDYKSLFKAAKTGEENIVRAMINGQPVYVKVHNPEAVKALLGMGSDQTGIVLGALQMLSNATKRGATGLLAPMFAVKNLTADTVQAAIQSPNAIKHIAVDMPYALISSVADVLRIPGLKNLAEDFRRSGGEYSALLRGDRPVNRAVFNLRKEAPLSTAGIAKGAVSALKAPFKGLEKIADVTENVNRMAAFRRAMVGKERTPENVRNAINAARESTTNFSRKGSFYQQTEALVPYSNAAVQGIYRIAKSFYKNPVKTLAGVGTLVIAPKLYEYAQFNDDPDYQKLPARERYRNVFVGKNKDGTFVKLPMPPEYEAFGAFMTDVMNHIIQGDPQAYKGTLDAVVNAFTPPLVSGALQGATQGGGPEQSLAGAINSTVAAPGVAMVANKSFTGAPIVPKRLEDVSARNQYDERTSSISKTIGEKIGMSPMKVDYLLRAYGGDPARLLLPLNSPVGGGTTRNTLLKNFISDPVFTNTLSDDFYTAKEKYTKAKNDNEKFGDPLPSWYSESMEKLINSQAKNSVSKNLSALNEKKRQISGDQSLGAKDKAQRLRTVQAQINEIYTDVNSQLVSTGFKFPNR
jgi:hypothetical protein